MSLFDIISEADEAFSQRNKRPYLEQLARAEAGIKSSEAMNAPQYYRGRSQEMENQAGLRGVELQNAPQYYRGRAQNEQNQAGLTGLQLQYAPERFNMERQTGALGNDLNRLRIEELRNKLKFGGGFEPSSTFGKLYQDAERAIKMYGENSPQAQQFKQAIEKQLKVSNGITMGVDENGRPLVRIGGSSKGGGSGGSLSVDQETGDIYSAPTRQRSTMEQASIGSHEDLERYIQEAIDVLPQFQNPWVKRLTGLQGFLNDQIGTQFDFPSRQAGGQAAIKKTIDKYIATANLPKIESSTQLVKEIFKPADGEAESGYRGRLKRELSDLAKTHENSQKRERQGYKVGNINFNQKKELYESQAKNAIANGADPAIVNDHLNEKLNLLRQ